MSEYGPESIKILEGLAAVRMRPGMYVGDTRDGSGLHHLLWEVVSNSIDEHLAGYATNLVVEIRGETIAVEDDGRGIPVEIEPHSGKPALELVMTRLHAGPTRDGHTPHVHIGSQLHGVGLAAVNALSSQLQVEIWRNGHHYEMAFARGELVKTLTELGPSAKTGTKIGFTPDPVIFASTLFSSAIVSERLRELSFLNPSLRVRFNDAEFCAPRGVVDYVQELVEAPRQPAIAHIRGKYERVHVDVALCWAGEGPAQIRSFVSQHRTRDGGTHVAGFWAGLRTVLATLHPAIVGMPTQRFRERAGQGLIAVIHAGLYDPVFGGPTKDRLASPEANLAVRTAVQEQLSTWLKHHPDSTLELSGVAS